MPMSPTRETEKLLNKEGEKMQIIMVPKNMEDEIQHSLPGMARRFNAKYIRKIRMANGKFRYFYTPEEVRAFNSEGKSRGVSDQARMMEKRKEIARRRRMMLDRAKSEGDTKKTEEEAKKTEDAKKAEDTKKTEENYDDVVNRIIKGEFGNGQERKDKLTKAGYDWAHIQNLVNEKLGSSKRHPTNSDKSKKTDEDAKKVSNDKKTDATTKTSANESSKKTKETGSDKKVSTDKTRKKTLKDAISKRTVGNKARERVSKVDAGRKALESEIRKKMLTVATNKKTSSDKAHERMLNNEYYIRKMRERRLKRSR